jgi:ribosomal-protein-alanine N-acetyltransferase
LSFADPIETERLLIRPFQVADFPQVCARVSNAEVTRFTGGTLSYEEARQLFQKAVDRQADTSPFGHRAIVLKASYLNIGYCGLGDLPHVTEKMIELSYGLNREHWGQGYAKEAAAALLQQGFSELKLTEVVAAIHPQNLASLRVAIKLGLAYRRKIDWPGQGQVNLYALRRTEYMHRTNFGKLGGKK